MAKTALIVDDNRALAEDLAEILETEGYRIRVFHDPKHVLDVGPGLDFDVALLDVRMPGMDGVTLQHLLMESHPNARFVLMTAYADDQRISQGLAAGASAVLTKPVPLEQLFAALGEGGAREVLLVEDDRAFREALEEALALNGYRCHGAGSADEARRVLEATTHELAAAIIDVRLPGESGAQLALDISSRSQLPCILITGWEPEEGTRIAGAQARLIVKPFAPETLLRLLAELRRARP